MKITLLVNGTRHVVALTEAGITVGRGDAATLGIEHDLRPFELAWDQ